MNNVNHKIEQHVQRQRLKITLAVTLIVVIVVPTFIWFVSPPMGESTIRTGVVTRLTGTQHDMGHTRYLVVKLENGSEVIAFLPKGIEFKKGHKVVVLEQKPLLFGRTMYNFSSYE